MADRKRLLWNGDAVASTGFARATHGVLETLRQHWDVRVLGINYFGDPHPYVDKYMVYPAHLAGLGDVCGIWRVPGLCKEFKPDVLVVQNDPWIVKEYLKPAAESDVPLVAFMPVDGLNFQHGAALNGLALAVFYTRFGLDEARKGGYEGPACVVPLGVDTQLYHPVDRREARRRVGFQSEARPPEKRVPLDAFVVGNVNRNQPRKRLDLTVAWFAEWVRRGGIDDAWLYLHLAPTNDRGWDLPQLAKYYGIDHRLLYTSGRLRPGRGVPEQAMPYVYGAFDVQMTTTQGEGFGLPHIEGMACGVPQLVPDWAALGDWTRDAAVKVPCTGIDTTPNGINVVGGIADKEQFIAALDRLYRDREHRQEYARRALALARRAEFSWPAIGALFHDEVERALLAWSPAPRAAEPQPEEVLA